MYNSSLGQYAIEVEKPGANRFGKSEHGPTVERYSPIRRAVSKVTSSPTALDPRDCATGLPSPRVSRRLAHHRVAL
jgi:hypothetical protein